MKLSSQVVRFALITSTLSLLCFSVSANSFASQAPARTSHINDFAGVVESSNRQRLDTILKNLDRKTGIQFDVATVKSTEGRDIFDYSRKLANDWDIGAPSTRKKSLLLVVAVGERTAYTQYSRTIQRHLPEGVLGDMALRMRGLLQNDQFDLGVRDAVEFFVSAMGRKLAFKLEDFDQATSETAAGTIEAPAAIETYVASGSETRKRQVSDLPIVDGPTDTAQVENKTSEATNAKATPIKANAKKVVRAPAGKTAPPQTANSEKDDADESEEVELTLTLPLPERAVALKEFLSKHPNSKSKPRAIELLLSTYAALGDIKLKNGDTVGGMEHFRLAVEEAPTDISEKLFSGVIAQIPMNLYLRNERAAAFKTAQDLETKFGGDPRRLLGISNFYLGIERGDEAGRLAEKAVALAPDMAEAHYVLGVSRHISLRLDEAIAEYKKAVELDPNFQVARRSLADLSRASGKSEDALTIYREQLNAAPNDKVARAGIVLSLLDLGRIEEGEKELDAALQEDPKNVSLLASAAYWYAAHNNGKRALELALRAAEIEPRYTWSQIALARSLVGERRPVDAERPIRFARMYGKFPTLDYELASVLAALGLYEEASEALLQSFTIKDGEIETRLGGRTAVRSENFIDLLAPERQGSIFQFAAADTPANARILKALLAFTIASGAAEPDERVLAAAGKEFASGDDEMRVYRQIYVATRLLRAGKALDTARELLDASRSAADAGLAIPAVTIAVQADELREIRSRAIATGGTPNIAEAPRNVLSNILRGRIEDLTGWVLFNQDKAAEAVEPLRRAVNVLPEGTPAWRTATWHLGAALEQTENKEEALNWYIKSYISGERGSARRALIESLYVKVHGSTDGLDQRIGPAASASAPASTESLQPAAATAVPEASVPPPTTTRAPSTTNAQPSTDPTTDPNASSATPAETPTVKQEMSTPSGTEPSSTPSPEPSRRSSDPSLSDLPSKPKSILKLTGRVKDAAGNGIANVVVVLISPRGSVLASTTDSEGNYSFTVSPSEKPFRVLPSRDGFSFTPLDKILVMTAEDQKDVDFVGAPAQSP